jgi:hypothetical protein
VSRQGPHFSDSRGLSGTVTVLTPETSSRLVSVDLNVAKHWQLQQFVRSVGSRGFVTM